MIEREVWFITGAGRGLGIDIAKAALAAGHAVVATGRDAGKVLAAIGEHEDLLTLKLDITRPNDAQDAVKAAIGKFGRIDVQKQLRLQAARQLMLSQNVDASSAGGLVGYESSSQFSREYSRLFGEPPQRDIKRMRLQ